MTYNSVSRNFSRINNGCYYFEQTGANSTDSKKKCEDLNSPTATGAATGTIFHLASLETEAETISIQLWIKGNNLK